jgi:hypothetical protein
VPGGCTVEIQWTQPPGAGAYRVFRSPAAGAPSGGEEWLDDVPSGTSTSFLDDGSAATDPAIRPLPPESLGLWETLPALPAALEGQCAAVGRDPGDPGRSYIYAAGGQGAATLVDSIGLLGVDVEADGSQTADAAWTTLAVSLSAPAWQCGAFHVAHGLNPWRVPQGETWLYFGGGLDGGGTLNPYLDGAMVAAGGSLGSFAQVDDNMRWAGFAATAAFNYLVTMGGRDGSPSQGGRVRLLGTSLPYLDNQSGGWNSHTGYSEPRYLMGSVEILGRWVLVGGTTDTEPATATTELAPF